VDRDEIEKLLTDARRNERPLVGFVLFEKQNLETEQIAVERQRRIQIADPQNKMIELTDFDHDDATPLRDGKGQRSRQAAHNRLRVLRRTGGRSVQAAVLC
jgi:hypothetical protein